MKHVNFNIHEKNYIFIVFNLPYLAFKNKLTDINENIRF